MYVLICVVSIDVLTSCRWNSILLMLEGIIKKNESDKVEMM